MEHLALTRLSGRVSEMRILKSVLADNFCTVGCLNRGGRWVLFAAGVLVHYFSPDGWGGCSLRGRPAIRDKMPVLIDEDLRFEDGCGPSNRTR